MDNHVIKSISSCAWVERPGYAKLKKNCHTVPGQHQDFRGTALIMGWLFNIQYPRVICYIAIEAMGVFPLKMMILQFTRGYLKMKMTKSKPSLLETQKCTLYSPQSLLISPGLIADERPILLILDG